MSYLSIIFDKNGILTHMILSKTDAGTAQIFTLNPVLAVMEAIIWEVN